MELQRAGLPALTWPAKFAPNGTTKLEAVTFAVVWKPPPDLLGKCPNLKAVHAIGAGVDSILPVVPPGIPVGRLVCHPIGLLFCPQLSPQLPPLDTCLSEHHTDTDTR